MRRPIRQLTHLLRSPYYRYHNARNIHALRVMAAILTSILATSSLGIPHGLWASVTVLVVIGGLQHHGDIRKKAGERALATCLGAGLGLLVMLQHQALGYLPLTYFLLSLLSAICAYYAVGKAGYVALLTAITLFIVAGHGDNQISEGLWRTLDVLLGAAIALAFSFSLPLYAAYDWRFKLAENLRECARLYPRLVVGEPLSAEEQLKAFAPLSARLVKLRALLPAAARELDLAQIQLEEIQRLHRDLLSTLELLATSASQRHQNAQWSSEFIAVYTRHSKVQRLLLAMSRSLRTGRVQHLQRVLSDLDNIPARPSTAGLPYDLLGPHWLTVRLALELRRMGELIAATRFNPGSAH